MAVFLKKHTRAGQLFPAPLPGETVKENPPTLSWLAEGKHSYTVTVWNDAGETVWQTDTTQAAAVPDRLLAAGTYSWDVAADGENRGVQCFTVPEDAIEFLRPTADEILAAIPAGHPRHLFTKEEIPGILATHEKELRVLRRNIEQAYKDGLPEPPRYHRDPDALPYREYFGRYRDYCDRNLVALALGYTLLGDEKAGAFARELFLTICDWNPEGPCSLCGPFRGDEIGLSNARCLPAVYDMLWPLLSDSERRFAAGVVMAYGYQCERLLTRLDFIANPGSSHAGRQPAYLGEAALVLSDSGVLPAEVCRRWLTYAAEVYGGMFPYFGTSDGGWAEGVFYSTSYTKWYLPFFSAVERYTGKSYLSRPFYRNLSKFFVHFADPEKENHPFCDGYWCHPEDAEWPGFFAQDPLGVYARRFGSELAKKRQRETPEPELYLLHLLDTFLPIPAESVIAEPEDNMAVFPEAGFAAMHTDLSDGEGDLACLIHATKFGSGSHRHADQGNFALFCGSTALLSPSGYFGREYGTAHHLQWTNATKAHNCVLIDGVGQGIRDYTATGKITGWGKKWNLQWVEADLSAAYPMLKSYTRKYRLFSRTLIVEDRIEAENPVTVDYLLHALSLPTAENRTAWVERNGKKLRITPVCGDLGSCTVTDEYDTPLNEGVPEAFHAVMPPQYHMKWQTDAKTRHCIVMRYDLL
ncbi:MAG: heparinase II/III family protein [Clostridia bacterium]|nr:heparinase II/III family protein [Clostridia bacterium]